MAQELFERVDRGNSVPGTMKHGARHDDTTARLNGDHLTANLIDLQPNTTYYYCAEALCVLGFGYGDWFSSRVKSFKTLPE